MSATTDRLAAARARRAPEMVCYGPKPAVDTLFGTRRLVWVTLDGAKGFYRTSGMSVREITRAIERMRDVYARAMELPPFDYAATSRRVRRALAHLVTLGKVRVVDDAARPKRWRCA